MDLPKQPVNLTHAQPLIRQGGKLVISLNSTTKDSGQASPAANRKEQTITLKPVSLTVTSEAEPKRDLHPAISAQTLLKELRSSLAEVLYIDESDIDSDKKFIEMGLDSIIGVEWVKAINKQYGTSIPATKIYDYPSIREFAGFLEKQMNKCVPTQVAAKPEQPNQMAQVVLTPSASIPAGQSVAALEQVNSQSSSIPVELLEAELTASLAKVLYISVG